MSQKIDIDGFESEITEKVREYGNDHDGEHTLEAWWKVFKKFMDGELRRSAVDVADDGEEDEESDDELEI